MDDKDKVKKYSQMETNKIEREQLEHEKEIRKLVSDVVDVEVKRFQKERDEEIKKQSTALIETEVERFKEEGGEINKEFKKLVTSVITEKIKKFTGEADRFDEIAKVYFDKRLTAIAHQQVMLAKAKRKLVEILEKQI